MDRNITAFILLFLIPLFSLGQTIDEVMPNIKKISAFIQNKHSQLLGTCFFIKFSKGNIPSNHKIYIVTAKHVIKDSSRYFDSIYLVVNNKSGGFAVDKIPLILKGGNQNTFISNDTTIDLGVIEYQPRNEYDIEFLDQSHILSRPDFNSNPSIIEGAETFFIGLFVNYAGLNQIQPIVRFGRLALKPKEKVPTPNGLSIVYLIENSSFGGNSGSPVYFRNIVGGQQGSFTLSGIMSGSFNDFLIKREASGQTKKLTEFEYNNGISFITPAYLLYELLIGEPKIK